jgi:TolA-binding protein
MNNNNDEISELEARLRAMQADERRKTEARFEEIERRVQQLESGDDGLRAAAASQRATMGDLLVVL